MFSTCSELTPRAPIRDGRMEQMMQPCRMGEQGVSLDNMEKMEKHFPHDLKYSDSKLST